MSPPASPRRSFLVPEVIQTSTMDCGPASVHALCAGLGIPLHYERLRTACQTDVDGTSIDTIETLLGELGLEAEQLMLPLEHLTLPEAQVFPAILVTRLAGGAPHFVVAWRRHGSFIQVMDPATGRRWVRWKDLARTLYIHTAAVPASQWREWALSELGLQPLRERLRKLGIAEEGERLIAAARESPNWRAVAALECASTACASLVGAGALTPGAEASAAFQRLYLRAQQEGPDSSTLSALAWPVRPTGPEEASQLLMTGAVLVRVTGIKPSPGAQATGSAASGVRTALGGLPPSPLKEILWLVREDRQVSLGSVLLALAVAAGGLCLEALLMHGLLASGARLGLTEQRVGAVAAVLVFLGARLMLELSLIPVLARIGRSVEVRLRLSFLRKLPRLEHRYFQTRLASDFVERCHSIHNVRSLAHLSGRILRVAFQILFTAAALAWFDPPSWPLALFAALAMLGLPALANPLLAELELRVRSYRGALARFHLDSLLGNASIRAHRASKRILQRHEEFLVEYARANRSHLATVVGLDVMQAFVGLGLAVWMVVGYLSRNESTGSVLLLAFWALQLPTLAQQLTQLTRMVPPLRNTTARLLELLTAPEQEQPETSAKAPLAPPASSAPPARGVSITFSGVSVQAQGQYILQAVDLNLAPGEHVAIVGASGAGKSTLVGLLLGLYQPSEGTVLVNGHPLASRLTELHRETAWVDPALQLWNRSLLDNLRYGLPPGAELPLHEVLHAAEFHEVVEHQSEGLQSRVGESGALLSGGEGQRLRLGRGLLRPGVRLVILDEPLRGLTPAQRRRLLERARAHWRDATLLCVTHAIRETLAFDRVLVVEGGRVVEDGRSEELSLQPHSHYRAMLDAEQSLWRELQASSGWRHWRLEGGQLIEQPSGEREGAPVPLRAGGTARG